MRNAFIQYGLFVVGIALIVAALTPATIPPTTAAPLVSISKTASEPATPTNTNTSIISTETPIPPTSTTTSDQPTPTDTGTPTDDPDRRYADPSVVKTILTTGNQVGETFTFRLTVTNTGNTEAESVIVEDLLPAWMTPITATASVGTVVISGRLVGVWIGSVYPGQVITIDIVAQIIASADPDDNRNIVTLTTTSSTDDPSNNTSFVIIDIPGDGGQPTPTATGVTDTPTPTLAVTATSTPVPPTPMPQILPITNDTAEQSTRSLIVLLLGLGLVSLSLAMRYHSLRKPSK